MRASITVLVTAFALYGQGQARGRFKQVVVANSLCCSSPVKFGSGACAYFTIDGRSAGQYIGETAPDGSSCQATCRRLQNGYGFLPEELPRLCVCLNDNPAYRVEC
ncbi:hypothetical protein Ptr902_08112 [Pyrenophora tritici-repentis]|nr:hypothetical protein Ptr902_08112 [Pyrenophora tritici-repentis]